MIAIHITIHVVMAACSLPTSRRHLLLLLLMLGVHALASFVFQKMYVHTIKC